MITFTDKGAEKVKEFLASQSADVQTSGLRVGVRGGGCSGFQYALAFDSQRDGDEVFEDQGLRILVEVDRPQFNELAEKGTLKSYRRAAETGHIKANGDSNVIKLIVQVVERQEQRSRLKKVH